MPTTDRQLFSSGAPWEEAIGYSRAVKVGPFIEVSGTTAVENGNIIGAGDAHAQMICVLQKIEKVLIQAGASLGHVTRTRIYVTDISQWEAIGRAHRQFFRQVKPASTMVEVKALIDPALLVEVEVTAYCP